MSDRASTVVLGLASLPEASTQSATVFVETADGEPMAFHTQNVKAIPAEAGKEGVYTQVRAAYRYDPARNAVVAVTPASRKRSQPTAWVWEAALLSRFDVDGQAQHVAQYHLENTGTSHIIVTLPVSALRRRVSLDDVELVADRSSSAPNRVLVPLPRGKRFPTLRVHFDTPGTKLRTLGEVRAHWPKIDLPCFKKTWSVWLPPSHFADFETDGETPEPRWSERLFACDVVRRGGKPFNLLAASDWRDFAQTMNQRQAAQANATRFLAALEEAFVNIQTQRREGPTWADWIGEASRRLSRERRDSGPTVAVDVTSLAAAGVTPLTILTDLSDPDIGKRLVDANVAVVAAPNQILVTSLHGVSRLSDVATRAQSPTAVVLIAADELKTRAIRAVAAVDWHRASPSSGTRWRSAGEQALLDLPLTGWHNVRLNTNNDGVTLRVYRRDVLDVIGASGVDRDVCDGWLVVPSSLRRGCNSCRCRGVRGALLSGVMDPDRSRSVSGLRAGNARCVGEAIGFRESTARRKPSLARKRPRFSPQRRRRVRSPCWSHSWPLSARVRHGPVNPWSNLPRQ